ncbi:MAG: 2-succinyl-5-enolpyruvyl-6-hydroxy-3-cyclohexene-1-carboxylic-acid synthase [Bacillales bacterium]|nr:2-succinyl-5-enolpyruvyl-6-hydroxy-3-cyclohexene-1-carboxylic-acid synthase [Bacillales bacterium]
MTNGNQTLTRYTATFVAHLYQAGMEEVVISPGSRSTPLALLCMHHPKLQTTIHIDERSAGFFALGRAKATRKSVGLICTSGSAAANYYPAIVEAKQSRVSLVVLTADRPHELRDVGAPQAMNQNQMYASYAKWYHETALPECSEMMLRYIGKIAERAVAVSTLTPKGVVHINFPFREPLMPNLADGNLWKNVVGQDDFFVSPPLISATAKFHSTQLKHIFEQITSKTRGLIVCGPEMDSTYHVAIGKLAEKLHIPVFTDILSQLRSMEHPCFIHSYDTLLRSSLVQEKLCPDWIIRFGAAPVSKALSQFMASVPFLAVVDEAADFRDPSHRADVFYCGSVISFCEQILMKENELTLQKSLYLSIWQTLHKTVQLFYKDCLGHFSDLEGKVVLPVLEQLDENDALMIANSMPIREFDSFYIGAQNCGFVYANRGVNGIDGLVSTAIGLAQSYPRLTLIIGDLAFYHDLSALLLLKQLPCNLKLILINNNGGGIFSFLPQANDQTYFEAVFGTPIDMDFQKAAVLYSLPYACADLADANQKIMELYETEDAAILEIYSDRFKNQKAHEKLWTTICQKIEPIVLELMK